MKILLTLCILSIFILNVMVSDEIQIDAQSSNTSLPLIKEPNFLIEEYVTGLDFPTTFDFIGNDILVLEKNGSIRLIENGKLLENAIEKIDVSTTMEEGLLGILTNENSVYLHYTTRDSDSDLTSNWFYKFNWNNGKLTEPILLKEIHGGSYGHNSGVMEIYNDQVIMVIGDLFNRNGMTQNNLSGKLDQTSVIMPIDPLGEPLAIGIRNSFGLDVDPKTGFLWDTENGDAKFDEINLIRTNFNSGWNLVQGPATNMEKEILAQNTDFVYVDPKFSWERTIGVTAIHIVTSSKFNSYNNIVLVGAFHNGNLYKFNLNSERNGFIFQDHELKDNVLNENDDSTEIIFATGFQGITDIKEGPDGNIYLLSIGDGKIFRLSPNTENYMKINYTCREKILEGQIVKNCNLSNMDLSNMDLSFSNFENSNLTNTSFKNSKIVNSNFVNSKISETDFSFSNLEASVILNNSLKNVDFSFANMKSVNLKNSYITNTSFKNSNLEFVSLSESIIENSDFSNSYLYYSDLSDSEIIGLNFSNSDLSFAKFHNVIASNANLSNSRLWKTQLNDSELSNINFKNSDNYFSTYANSNLQNSNFKNSRFSDVDFSNANLSGSFLLDIYPINNNFENTFFDQTTKINTCLNSDLVSKMINRIFRTTNINNSQTFEPLQHILLNICN